MALDDSSPRKTGARDAEDEVVRLFRAEYASLVRLASLLLADPGASEEVVQDAFVKLQTRWGTIRNHDRAAAWLRSAVLNGARSRLRRLGVRRRHPEASRRPEPSAEARLVERDEHRHVIDALRGLPSRQREALVLKFYLELSEAETAAAMGVSAGTVKTHVHRGLATLHTILEPEPDDQEETA